jgi:hypothetical protein
MSNNRSKARTASDGVLNDEQRQQFADTVHRRKTGGKARSLIRRVWDRIKGWARKGSSATKSGGQAVWRGTCATGRGAAWGLYQVGRGWMALSHWCGVAVQSVVGGAALIVSVTMMAAYTVVTYACSILMRVDSLVGTALKTPHLMVRSRQEKKHLAKESWTDFRTSLRPSNLHIFPRDLNDELARRQQASTDGGRKKTGPTPRQARRRPATMPIPRTA